VERKKQITALAEFEKKVIILIALAKADKEDFLFNSAKAKIFFISLSTS